MATTRRTLFSLLGLVGLVAGTTNLSSCTCGFYDATEDNLWTDSIVVYFNESITVPEDIFLREDYRNKWEQGWNSQFIQGAAANNAWIGNSTSNASSALASLQLFVEPADWNHVVTGGGIRSQRQDIQYGSFRAMMKGPPKNNQAGTSLSMMLPYNLTQQISLNIQNTQTNETAWISTLMNHEFPNRYLGVNLTNISNPDFGINPIANPWDYNDMRIDWTPNIINYWLGNNLSRSVSGSADDGTPRPSVPVPLELKHWSDGNEYAMAGPPMKIEAEANVLYIRAFFNTSSKSSDEVNDFNDRCSKAIACSTDDLDLRGATDFPASAKNQWQQIEGAYTIRWPAIGILAFGVAVSITTLLNVILRKLILPSAPKEHGHSPAPTEPEHSNASRDNMSFTSGDTTPLAMHRSPYASGYITPMTTGARTIRESASASGTLVPPSPVNLTRPSSSRGPDDTPPVPRIPGCSIPDSPYNLTRPSSARGNEDFAASRNGSVENFSRSKLSLANNVDEFNVHEDPVSPGLHSGPPTPFSPGFPVTPFSPMSVAPRNLSFLGRIPDGTTFAPAVIGDTGNEEVIRGGVIVEQDKGKNVPISSSAAPKDSEAGGKPAPRQKIDYLAGLLAVCSTLVSVTHFMLTFLPATIEPTAFAHYNSENWARKTIGWFMFNEVWVVLFFTTSSRFLTTKYLRTGDLQVIAEKATSRTFRLMIPIIGVIILEYFLMDVGGIDWLQYLPSISWSTWPYTVVYNNFGDFISETLELIYLIPNAQPQITFNYCTGVLWTIPVQLDGSWQAMLGVIIFREIKTPWKRFGYYFVVILTHWYARSWGAFFIAGLCMADMDVTYKYRKFLYARKWLYYPLLNLVIFLALAGLGNDLVSQWTGVNFQVIEDGWHIDKLTGFALVQVGRRGFPPYYVPKLNGLIFAICAQLLVEWSTVLQKIISIKIVLWLFPHIFTIYLFHGFIFWSVGSAVCVGLGGLGVPYWANMLITAIACYGVLYLSLPIITPVVEALGKTVTSSIWNSASEQPPPKRHTLYPFPDDLFTSRNVDNPLSEGSLTSSSASSFTDKSGKGGKGSGSATDSSASSFIMELKPTAPDSKGPIVSERPVMF